MITIDQLDDLKRTLEQRSKLFIDAIEHVKQLVAAPDMTATVTDNIIAGMPERNEPAKERRVKTARRSSRQTKPAPTVSFKAVIEQAMRAIQSPFNADDVKAYMKANFNSVYHAMGASTISGTIARMHTAGQLLKAGDRHGRQAYQLPSSASVLPPKEAAYRQLRSEMQIPQPVE